MKNTTPHEPEASETPEKKHNLGAKLGVAVTLGSVIGGKLAIPGTVMDLNSLFPKGTPLSTKFKQTFSKEIIPLFEKAIVKQMTENGHGQKMATLAAMKWSLILPTFGGIVLGVFGWKRADRIENSKDIVKHPIKSAKIIFGLEEPPLSKSNQTPEGKHASAVLDRRSSQATNSREL